MMSFYLGIGFGYLLLFLCYVITGMFGGLIANILWKYAFNSPWGLSAVIPGLIVSALLIVVISLLTYNTKNPPVFFDVKKGEVDAQAIEAERA